ncbi:MAG TPA: ABC transporter permease [Rubrobacteraceae bacterium]|nr:ABC transporter permease [Rubrobacteraceae bacterium]
MQPRLERRLSVPAGRRALVAVLSVAAALVLGAVFLVLAGFSPVVVYSEMFRAAFTSYYGITDSLAVAIPIILTGLAAAVAFRMRLYNIGAEGQLYVGAIFSTWAALAIAPGLPAPVAIVIVLATGALGGAVWILVPALARAYLGTSEIITTLLLNFVALYLMRYLIYGSASYWRDPASTNFPQGKPIPEEAYLPVFGLTRIHLGLAVALLAAALLWALLSRTRFGYDVRVVGDSESAAWYAGIPIARTVVVVMLISGALAGLAGAGEVAGIAHTLDPNGLAVNFGYTGIIVAALARSNPLVVVPVAVLLGGLQNAGTALQSIPGGGGVPVEVSFMMQGLILLCALAGELFVLYRLRLRRVAPEEIAEEGPPGAPEGART